ncbi:hypothetical protein OPT61_g689 [Boeremia exigua]|uniref:Uncharacterized protein n=1 Tax=Boeremia exigua TaxID=749465 RepID=A0ACC2IT37_9PLEO|nr:hypothetical protein OPT61_g689 [Boeremia exigua]
MSDSEIYPHPLKGRTVRLFTVEPGDVDDPITCTLSEASLDESSNSYNALSYCWGASNSSVWITCNSRPLSITPNLHAALCEYRRRATSTPLWVDAVCIDQSNTAERTAQVRMMQTIYSEAACVIVWLGEAEATDTRALELLKMINAPWATFTHPSHQVEIPLFTGQDTASHDALVAAQVPDAWFDALAAFLMRPWFSRIWIVQEIVSAKNFTIWCGPDTLNEDFPVLEASARLLQMSNCNVKIQLATTALPDKNVQGAARSKLMCSGRLWGFKNFREIGVTGIFWNLLITRSFDATDPRDKIFALAGLATDVGEDFVDYSKSYEHVIRELSHMLLDGTIPTTSGSALDIWSCITRDDDDELDGPSWVVDWLKLRDSLYTPLMSQYVSEKPAIQRRPEVVFSSTGEEETLHVRGILFDTIAHIVPSPVVMRQLVPQSDFLTSQHLPGIIAWYEDVKQAAGLPNDPEDEAPMYQPTGEFLYDAFWRTLCCNRTSSSFSTPPADNTSFRAWERLLSLQSARHELELHLRGFCTRQIRIAKASAAFAITALTYRFRNHKLLFVALPFALPPLFQLIDMSWNIALRTNLLEQYKEYIALSTEVQIEQREFEGSHASWTQGRLFGITERGMIGWVPVTSRVGDCVGLFAGCRVPFVLRGTGEGWKIVGDAYVHGAMEGEGQGLEGDMLRIFNPYRLLLSRSNFSLRAPPHQTTMFSNSSMTIFYLRTKYVGAKRSTRQFCARMRARLRRTSIPPVRCVVVSIWQGYVCRSSANARKEKGKGKGKKDTSRNETEPIGREDESDEGRFHASLDHSATRHSSTTHRSTATYRSTYSTATSTQHGSETTASIHLSPFAVRPAAARERRSGDRVMQRVGAGSAIYS